MKFLKALTAVRAYFFYDVGYCTDKLGRIIMKVGKEGGNPMLHQLIGKLVWHISFIALLTTLFTLPFIWMPSIWNYTVGGVEITKYVIVVVASIISFTCLTVTIKK